VFKCKVGRAPLQSIASAAACAHHLIQLLPATRGKNFEQHTMRCLSACLPDGVTVPAAH
jgi:hypothetical protein